MKKSVFLWIFSLACFALAGYFAYMDYSLKFLGDKQSFGGTYFFYEPIKVIYVAVLLIIVGTVCAVKAVKARVK